jgi:hypothetical protein
MTLAVRLASLAVAVVAVEVRFHAAICCPHTAVVADKKKISKTILNLI